MTDALDLSVIALMRQVARDVIMPRYRNLKAGEVVEKTANDFVTIADRESEEALAAGLTAIEPVAVVGEEAAYADPTVFDRLVNPCWIVDPIDGTANFARGEGPFGIMIALAEGGLVQRGWILHPQTDRLYHARRGGGAFLDGVQVAVEMGGHNPPILSMATGYMSEAQREIVAQAITPHYNSVPPPMCAAAQYPMVAEGVHDLAVFQRTLPWDHAAGCLFLNEAGGVCQRIDGSEYRVDSKTKGMIAAADHRVWDGLAERFAATDFLAA